MANPNLEPESAPATNRGVSSEMRELYLAYARIKAEWEAWTRTTYGLREDASEQYCAEHTAALDALLLTPASSASELYLKLSVFDVEEVEDGWHCAREIVATLAADAGRLAAVERLELAGFEVSPYARKHGEFEQEGVAQ